MYVSWLKKNLSYFSLLSHTLIISLKGGNTLLFPFYFLLLAHLSLDCLLFSKGLTLGFFFWLPLSLHLPILCLCLLECSNPLLSPSSCVLPKRKSLLFSFGFTLCFSSPQMEDPWAKSNKFFIALFIYKTLFLFPLELGIHYFFNKK